jgi:hypothetical protein
VSSAPLPTRSVPFAYALLVVVPFLAILVVLQLRTSLQTPTDRLRQGGELRSLAASLVAPRPEKEVPIPQAQLARQRLGHGWDGARVSEASRQKSYRIRPYQNAPLKPNGVYWL